MAEFKRRVVSVEESWLVTEHTEEAVEIVTSLLDCPPPSPDVEHIGADRARLSWRLDKYLGEEEYVEVHMKDMTKTKSRWKLASDDNIKTWPYTVTDLNPDNEYVFKIRIVNDSDEGDFSPESRTIKTKISAAVTMKEISEKIEHEPIQKYRIPVEEVKEARNESRMTRRFEIGTRPEIPPGEKTILLVGATGTGKSTLVDGIINYIYGVNWTDDFRFTLIRIEGTELEHQSNQAVSQTDWITCYTIYPSSSSRITFTLNLIDTPGFGDTRGFERDEELIGQIRHLFSKTPPKGVTIIDAVCFLVKSPDARLTAVQRYIFQQIMSLFGKDIEKNICTLITFADGEEPPVLHALKESELPFGQEFRFNNSALFAKNKALSSKSFAPMFWDLGLKSFEQFFEFLTTLEPRSLAMTKSVLEHRNKLETTKNSLMPLVDQGLSKLNEIQQEITIFENNKSVISRNKDFKYIVSVQIPDYTDLPPGQHTTNCKHCNVTCHENCKLADDKDKARCCAMGSNGNCTHCPSNCHWSAHTNSQYTVKLITVNEERILEDVKQKYKDATGKLPSLENVLTQKKKEFEKNTEMVNEMLQIVNSCNNTLKEIALRPSPLSTTDYIDTLIKSEEMEKRPGFTERVQSLRKLRRRAEIDTTATTFTMNATMTLSVVAKTTGKGITTTVVDKICEYRDKLKFHLFKK